MRLGVLLAAAGLGEARAVAWAGEGPEVSDLVISSTEVSPGALFACVPGARADGHDFAGEAVKRGAVATLCERRLDISVPQVLVPSVRGALGPVSAALWGNPSQGMHVAGVTGTNGKTTTCAFLAGIFEAQGWPTGVIGTLTGARTTPEAPALQRRLAELKGQGKAAVCMEVSSHALDQQRTSGTSFAAALFTNLSQDHLDYHGTMESYFAAKAKLFDPASVRLAVVNRADPWGAKLVRQLEHSGLTVTTFAGEDASELVLGQRSASFMWRGQRLDLNIGGRFNVVNALGAATVARELGAGWGAVAAGLTSVRAVRGRFEPVEEGQPFAVLVDFAHTPAALAEALSAGRELVTGAAGAGRVILVFGAGGDRDRSKRPLMGAVASQLADVVIITSDNPRSEDPFAIIEEVAGGARGERPLVHVDRGQAIAAALALAGAGDVVLIAGKGHETGQDFGTHVEPFDDVEVARDALLHLRTRTQTGPVGPSSR